MVSRSPERDYYRARDARRRDDAESKSHKTRRSRSPRDDRVYKRERESPYRSPPKDNHRSHWEDGRHSSRERNSKRHNYDDHRRLPHQRERSPRRSDSYDDQRYHSHRKSHRRSPFQRSRTRSPPDLPSHSKRSNAPLPSQKSAFNGNKNPTSDAVAKFSADAVEKQKPNYAPTGKLAAETNTVANTTIVLKYNEPPEARLPPASFPWRLYIFKGSEILETLPLHTRTCWLFGRERAVVDHATEHPSCSKQHAVIQFRYVERKEKEDEFGEKRGGVVKPYVIDLESANGTKVNGERVPDRRYVEVRSGDVITFGESTREYVMLMPPKEEKKP